MRDYGLVTPSYWTGPTGRQIRAMGQAAQLVGAYLLTAPGSNMIGLYYLPLVILGHETNCSVEEARQILAALSSIDYAYYDEGQETVWVKNMAFYQVGETVETRDNRWPAIIREVLAFSSSPFYARFLEVYGEPFHLLEALGPSLDGSASPLQAPSKGLRRASRKHPKAPTKPLQSPSKDPSGLGVEGMQAPPKPEAGAGTEAGTGTGSEAGAAGATPQTPSSSLPKFMEKDLKALGVSETCALDLIRTLGRGGLQCAVAKLRTKSGGRNLAGLLVTRGAELAQEGRAILQEGAQKALGEAPGALKDSRWINLPAELREDLEAQAAWATWFKAETHLRECPRDDEAPMAERSLRRSLMDMLAARHPDQAGFRARLEACMPPNGTGGLTAQAVKLQAMTKALGLERVPAGVR